MSPSEALRDSIYPSTACLADSYAPLRSVKAMGAVGATSRKGPRDGSLRPQGWMPACSATLQAPFMYVLLRST